MKLFWKVSTSFIIILLLFVFLIKDKLPRHKHYFGDIGSYNIPGVEVEVNASSVYGQSFKSNFDNFFMISIFIPKQDLNSNKELYFHLKNRKEDTQDLVMLKWQFNQIRAEENSFYVVHPAPRPTHSGFHFHFQFPVIKYSKNKEYYFYFDAPQTKAGEGIKVGFWDAQQHYEALTEGKMFINNKPASGFLAFRTYNTYSGGYKEIFSTILYRLNKDKQFLSFYLGLIICVAISLGLVSVKPTKDT